MLFWRYLKDYLLSYTYNNNQVFLVSFPKTGRTWLSYMLDQIEDKSDDGINTIWSNQDLCGEKVMKSILIFINILS